ncbi:MAG: heavy-metal-associated domain-containing protein [Cyclobacteriaceae bacterium]|nr:heavy-metal-associated domain-containing protein [Cyclobacteriaceae bacterium]
METISLSIPSMKSSHCQLTVTRLVQNAGAQVKQVTPGNAEIELSNGITKAAVIEAIEKGGYPVIQPGSCCAA